MVETNNYEVREGRTELEFPGEEMQIKVVHPFEGADTYREVGQGILNRKLTIPTPGQTAYLLHAAYCGPEQFRGKSQVDEVRDNMAKRYFWVFNRNLWTDKGVYVVSDPEAIGLTQTLNLAELETRARDDQDRSVRFAPKGSYKLGDHSPESFAQDGFVIATFGQKAAEQLAEVAGQFRYNPRTWGVEVAEEQQPEQRLSAVIDYNGRLNLYGGYGDNNRAGCASGVVD